MGAPPSIVTTAPTLSLPSSSQIYARMASTIARGFRGGLTKGLQRSVKPSIATPARRAFATPVGQSSMKSTTLANGFTIATEHSPYAQTSTVGVWIDAGSRAETDRTNGTAHFLEHLAFKGTQKRTQNQLELEIENMGGHLNAYTSRENTVYYAKAFNSDVPATVDILSDILQNSKLEPSAIERERDAILGPKENIQSIQRNDLENYIKTNYTADRMVLVGAGGVPHEQLVELAEKHFSKMPQQNPNSQPSAAVRGLEAKPDFVGSEVRIRDDTMPTANIAIAVEGVSWKDDDYFTALVTQAIVGNWDRAMGNSPYLGSKLSTFVHEHKLANSFMSFSTSYSDTGLWGIYLVTDNFTRIDDLAHFTLREWSRLSFQVGDAEVERAKAQLKASILLSLDGTTAVAEGIGRQIITTGRRLSPEEVERAVDSITAKDVMSFAQRKLWDKDIAISAVGQIEGLLDYARIRNDMTRMLS